MTEAISSSPRGCMLRLKSLSLSFRKTLGLIFLITVIASAFAFHWLGPGLITVREPAFSSMVASASRGVALGNITSYHHALIPLVIFGLTSLVLALAPAGAFGARHAEDTASHLLGPAALVAAGFSLVVRLLSPYLPGGVAFSAAIVTLVGCSLSVVLAVATLSLYKRHRWTGVAALILALAVLLSHF